VNPELFVSTATLYGLPDYELDKRIFECALPIKSQRICELIATGLDPKEAALKVGIASRNAARAGSMVMASPESRVLIELHRERIRRFSGVSVEWLQTRFRDIASRAQEAKDFRSAIAALKEMGMLAGAYPDQRLTLDIRPVREISDADVIKLAALSGVLEAEFTSLEEPQDVG
jgi:hypothetical protein